MTDVDVHAAPQLPAPHSWRSRLFPATRRQAAVAILCAAALLPRLAFLAWDDPYGPHHPDEHILSIEALGLWEGVTPREVGWPASTTRLLLSGANGTRFLAGHAGELLTGSFQSRLASVSRWIGGQIVQPDGLYAVGRALCLAVALLQIAVTWWALRQWLPRERAWFGTLAAALTPVAVSYSQFVLADVMGLLWATLVLGLVRRPSRSAALGAATAAGLAAASKFHFGIWLLAVLASLLTRADLPWRERTERGGRGLLACGLVMLLLVPWFWTSPLLALKEFAGVVLVKIGGARAGEPLWTRTAHLLGGLGAFSLVGAALGIVPFWRNHRSVGLVVLVPAALAIAALLPADIVFDRYALVVAPAVFLLAGAGWGRMLDAGRARWLVGAVAAVALLLSGADLVRNWQWQREASVDQLAAAWIRTHVAPGTRVALHSEANAYLPRTTRELDACAARPSSDDAYVQKWATNGVRMGPAVGQPFRNAVLNDEMFQGFICARELMVPSRETGFETVRFHDGPRFDAVPTGEAENLFANAQAGATGGVDVLVTNRPVRRGIVPTTVIRTRLGARFIYARPSAMVASSDGSTSSVHVH